MREWKPNSANTEAARANGYPMRWPVLGDVVMWHRDPAWDEYSIREFGNVSGLARVSDDGRRVDVLTIDIPLPYRGRGHCSRFIDALLAAYDVVGVWEVANFRLRDMLIRRGFVRANERFPGDSITDVATGYRWTR